MTRNRTLTILSLGLLIAFFATFLFVSPAFAQDEVPPEVVPTETPAEVLPTDAALAEVMPTETEPVEELPFDTAPLDQNQATEPSLAEQLDDAGIALVDERGNVLSLATAAAEVTLANTDPWFTHKGITYRFMTDCTGYTNCTTSATPIQAAINAISGGKIPVDNFLHFESGAAISENVVINGVVGLKGLLGVKSADTLEPNVTINGSLTVSNMVNGFQLESLNFTGSVGTPDYPLGVIDFYNNGGTIKLFNVTVTNSNADGVGISIVGQTGGVEMSEVDASGSAGGGAFIQNSGNVSIKNSSFDNNAGNAHASGLTIGSSGVVSIDGVSASGNGDANTEPDDPYLPAMDIYQSKSVTIKNCVFTGNANVFGFVVENNSTTVSLDNVNASDNLYGFWVNSRGNISANNIQAVNNDGYGAVFDTCHDSTGYFDGLKDQTCTNTGTGNITISNSGFSNNTSNKAGLAVFAKGSITLTNVEASDNRGYDRDTGDPTSTTSGAWLYNYGSTGIYPVTLNTSTFNGNSENGINVYTRGLVTFNKVKANGDWVDELGFFGNGAGAAFSIDNKSFGTSSGVIFNGAVRNDNEFLNYFQPVDIQTNGPVTLNYVHIILRDSTLIETPADVKINYSDFYSINSHGLAVISLGNISLKNINSTGFSGTLLDNRDALNKTVSVIGGDSYWSSFNNLEIFSKGTITLTNVKANDANGIGAWLDNASTGGSGNIIISGSEFNRNTGFGGGLGLWLNTNGTITLTNTQVLDNDWGININSSESPVGKPKGLTVNGGEYQNLWGTVYGKIDISNIETINGAGVSLNNAIEEGGIQKIYSVTISNSHFDHNYSDGLWITSFGSISVKNTTANGNFGWGGWLDNFAATVAQPVSLSGCLFDGNEVGGLNIQSKGVVKLTNTGASENSSHGFNSTPLVYGDAITDGASFDYPDQWNFSGNFGDVISIVLDQVMEAYLELWWYDTTIGKYVMINYDDNRDGDFTTEIRDYSLIYSGDFIIRVTGKIGGDYEDYSMHLWLDSDPYAYTDVLLDPVPGLVVTNTGGAGVTITNPNASEVYRFENNSGDGVTIDTAGPVVLAGMVVNSNRGAGALIGSELKPVKSAALTGTNTFNENFGPGLDIRAIGAISLTNVSASSNWLDDLYAAPGVYLDNTYGSTPANVSLISNISTWTNEFFYNQGTGLEIHTKGAVTVSKVNASENAGEGGVFITNMGASTPASVTLNFVTANMNLGNGLTIESKGIVTVNSLTANENSGAGATINNTFSGTTGAAVNVTKSIFNLNTDRGLYVQSRGTITVNNLTANDNLGEAGVELNNQFSGAPGLVWVVNSLGANNFNNNIGFGLKILTNKAVSVKGVSTIKNTGYGVWVNNFASGTGSGAVTLTSVVVKENSYSGLRVDTNGAVTISGLISMLNGVDDDPNPDADYEAGVVVRNHNTAFKTTITGSVVVGNYKYGILIYRYNGAYPAISGSTYFGNNRLGGYHNLLMANFPS